MNINKKIETVAYYKWLNAGQPEGKHEEFWIEAEKEVQEDQQLSSDVRCLWQAAQDQHDGKIQTIWQKVRNFLSKK